MAAADQSKHVHPDFYSDEHQYFKLQAHKERLQKNRPDVNNSEVEYIDGIRFMNSKRYYQVKWKDWPVQASTWEPISDLKCKDQIVQYHKELGPALHNHLNEDEEKLGKFNTELENKTGTLLEKQLSAIPEDFEFQPSYARQKRKLYKKLAKKQNEINSNSDSLQQVSIENEVDLEDLPISFEYVYENTDRIPKKKRKIENMPIDEFERRCQCSHYRGNEVLEGGSKCKLCIFKKTNKGWGVKALETIPKGVFVIDYVGEVITKDEALNRKEKYKNDNVKTYFYRVDPHSTHISENPKVIDATLKGNASRLINHSRDPNCKVNGVYEDNLKTSLPRVTFFAKRRIEVNEEVTINYEDGN